MPFDGVAHCQCTGGATLFPSNFPYSSIPSPHLHTQYKDGHSYSRTTPIWRETCILLKEHELEREREREHEREPKDHRGLRNGNAFLLLRDETITLLDVFTVWLQFEAVWSWYCWNFPRKWDRWCSIKVKMRIHEKGSLSCVNLCHLRAIHFSSWNDSFDLLTFGRITSFPKSLPAFFEIKMVNLPFSKIPAVPFDRLHSPSNKHYA